VLRECCRKSVWRARVQTLAEASQVHVVCPANTDTDKLGSPEQATPVALGCWISLRVDKDTRFELSQSSQLQLHDLQLEGRVRRTYDHAREHDLSSNMITFGRTLQPAKSCAWTSTDVASYISSSLQRKSSLMQCDPQTTNSFGRRLKIH